MARSRKYQKWLLEVLKDREFATEYLNEALEESLTKNTKSEQAFLIALKNVICAQGGVSKIAKKANLGRANLYRMLSSTGNPKWTSLIAILKALDLKLMFC